MTIRTRWLLTTLSFVLIGEIALIGVGALINLYGARRGAYEWFHSAYGRAVATYNDQLFARLEATAAALSREPGVGEALARGAWSAVDDAVDASFRVRDADDIWLLKQPSGAVEATLPACAGDASLREALPGNGKRVFAWCGDTLLMIVPVPAPATAQRRLFLGHWLGDRHADELSRITGTEVEIWGERAVATSFRTSRGDRASIRLDAEALQRIRAGRAAFAVESVRVPGGYRGFLPPSRDGVPDGTAIEAGMARFDAFIFSRPLGGGDASPRAPRIVIAAPVAVMTTGVRYATVSMIAVGIALLAVLALIASRLVRSFTRPLALLERGARDLAAGACRVRVEESGDREVASLARSFNEMVASLDRAQARIVQADKMAALGLLSAGVAHEINNPLTYTLTNVKFASEQLVAWKGQPSPRAADIDEVLGALDDARHGAERVHAIVRDLRTFARSDDDGLSDESCDVRDVLRHALKFAHAEIRHRARVVEELEEVPPVRAGAHRLGQVFLNLIINAAHSIDEGHVERNELRVACRLEGEGRVIVEIQDTGCGIPEDQLARIFDPFFTTKPVGMGTGLGLSICHGVVSQLGGEITAESRAGAGSTFRVVLPAVPAPSARCVEEASPCRRDERVDREVLVPSPAAPAPRDDAASAGPRRERRTRVMIVDDEPMVMNALERMLVPRHEVVAVTSARSALARLEEDRAFDVVICDLMMPEMTGMQLHERLAAVAPEVTRRIVFITGGVFTDRTRDFLQAVTNPLVEKPFDAATLRSTVEEVLRRNVAEPAA